VSFERFCGYISCKHYSLPELAGRCSLIFITTPDDAISGVARALHESVGERCHRTNKKFGSECDGEMTLIHCSGALSWRVLDFAEDAREKGGYREDNTCWDKMVWRYGGIHPYRAFSSIEDGIDSVRGTHFGVDASDEESMVCAQDIVLALGGIFHRVPEDGKTLYHAAAVVASNYLVVLGSLGTELLEGIGLSSQESLELLLPLMQGTLDNMKKSGLDVLTGPIARGDVEVVRRHLAQLPENMRGVYCSLGMQALELGRRKWDKLGRNYPGETELKRILSGQEHSEQDCRK
jgi:hypothetical protein